jgi:biotin operon repressor
MTSDNEKTQKIRDLRKQEMYRIDDGYLNGYAKICGVYSTAVYNSLSRHSDEIQHCFPSIEKMAEQHGCNRKSIIKGIQTLERLNIIRVDRITHRGKSENNGYTLLDKSEWKKIKVSPREGLTSDSKVSPREGLDQVLEKDCKGSNSIYDINTIRSSHDKGAKSTYKKELTPAQQTREFFENKEFRQKTVEWLIKKNVEPKRAKSEIQNFVSYWTELNSSGSKQRWELQQTFELKRRLTTWFKNSNEWSKNKQFNKNETLVI